MYNTREALAYSGKLPVQQNQAGVTPQLLDLLALQKVDADKKAAAQALAMASGQANMPTVAQGIEQQALNSARGEIAQKLGLAGLAQQQAPQGPQGPVPQQPPAQGIASAPSPLPESYQEGGIVAFAEAGQVPKADSETDTYVDDTGVERNTKTGEPVAQPYVERDLSRRQPGIASLAKNTAPQNRVPTVKAAGLADVAKANMSAAPAAAVKPSGPPVMSPENIAFVQAQKDRIASEQALDPEKLEAASQAKYDERIGKNALAAVENQKSRIAGIEALYARQAAERAPSWLTGLQRMGENARALPGQQFQGVSSAITKANEGYTTQDIANRTAVDTLNTAMEKAIRDNDIGAYNAAKLGRDEAVKRIAEAGKEGTTMADVLERTLSQERTNYNTVEGRKAEMAMRVREINARAAEAAQIRSDTASRLAFENDQKQAMALALKAAQTEKDSIQNVGKYDTVSVEELALPLYQKFLAELTAKPGAPRATAPTIAPPPPGAVRLKK